MCGASIQPQTPPRQQHPAARQPTAAQPGAPWGCMSSRSRMPRWAPAVPLPAGRPALLCGDCLAAERAHATGSRRAAAALRALGLQARALHSGKPPSSRWFRCSRPWEPAAACCNCFTLARPYGAAHGAAAGSGSSPHIAFGGSSLAASQLQLQLQQLPPSPPSRPPDLRCAVPVGCPGGAQRGGGGH